MPFWWGRRRKPWFGRWRYKTRTARRTKRRRFPRRRRHRRPYRRRRKPRKRKVRRKKKKINIQQWQPQKIVKCKIKGRELFLFGANGKQFACFTHTRDDWTPSKNPGGGGFAVDKYTLESLYTDYTYGRNIWTKSNVMTDLCRYTGCVFEFYRHPETDFYVNYNTQPPFTLQKDTYPNTHPYYLSLHKRTKFIPSKVTKPHGKQTVKIRIKPPKTLQTSWYFQETFSKFPLLQLSIAAANVNYSYNPPTGTNMQMTFLSLNHQFYQRANWGLNTGHAYNPIGTMAKPSQVYTDPERTKTKNITMYTSDNYDESISYDKGWFQTALLSSYGPVGQDVVPISAGRYNPELDNGKGNAVWLVSITSSTYSKPSKDKDLIIEGKPLWQLFYGFFNYVNAIKKDSTFLRTYICVFESPAVYSPTTVSHTYHIPIDRSFIDGKAQWGLPPTAYQKTKWFPTLEAQLETINNIVQCGPLIPKYNNERNSNWQLSGKYTFYFKWGGTLNPDEAVADPENQGTYITPSNINQAIQIINPTKQAAESILHCWDYRRGLIKKTALQRILENQQTDTDFQTDSEPPRKKKKKKHTRELQQVPEEEEEIQESLLQIFKEDSFPESADNQQLFQLLQQQQQQHRDNKYQLLKLIADLKKKQQLLQLQTGLLT
nr:MAG: ORF1 [Torque teno midi virus]